MYNNSENPIFLMIPKPSPYPLIRLGGDADGSYIVPNDLENIDSCFSPGVSSYKYFEDSLVEYGIKSYMCDYSVDVDNLTTPLIEGFQIFDKKWLDITGDSNSVSIEEWVNQYSPDQTKDLILQMDIEGAEYRNILSTDRSVLNRFRIILMEVHYLREGDLWTTPLMSLPQRISDQFSSLLKKLDETHTCVHVHPNNSGGEFLDIETGLNVPNVVELTYLRKDRFVGDIDSFYQPQVPHPLDIVNNEDYSPLVLNKKWKYFISQSIDTSM